MAEIRGEKVIFRKGDIVPLDALPSAQGEDRLIVNCPPPRRRIVTLLRFFLFVFLFFVAAAGSLFFAVESGALDAELSNRAEAVLNESLKPRFEAKVGSAALRFSPQLKISVEARDVDVTDPATGERVSRAEAVRLVADPLALAMGTLRIAGLEADGMELDTALLRTGSFDLAHLRVDRTPAVLEEVFERLDVAFDFLDRSQAGTISLSRLSLRFPGAGEPYAVELRDVTLARAPEGPLTLSGVVSLDGGEEAAFSVNGHGRGKRLESLDARLGELELAPLALKYVDGNPRIGVSGKAGMTITARRGGAEEPPLLAARISGGPGLLYADGIGQEISEAGLDVSYDFAKNAIEFLPSKAVFGPTVLPFTGAVIDRDRLEGETGPGFALDFLIRSGVSGGPAAAPVTFDAKATGVFRTDLRELRIDRLMVTSAEGSLGGSLVARFNGRQSPEISFGGEVPQMSGEAVKQLWPYWMANKPRQWALDNLFGGTVRNGSISVFIPFGKLGRAPLPLDLDANELRISFDVEGTRLDLPQEIPPLRDATAHVDVRGGATTVTIAGGTSYFGSGRSARVEGGRFAIADAYAKPLMADLDLSLSGDAAALLELSSFKPMNSLEKTDYKPQDFSGPARVELEARFGLIESQSPPQPVWKAKARLEGVDVHREIAGRKITAAEGVLDVDRQALRIEGKARVDDAPVEISLTEPVGQSGVKRDLAVRGTLEKSQWRKVVPELAGLIEGPLSFDLARIDDQRQAVKVDLGAASVSVPWLGWTKGPGVAAQSRFELSSEGAETRVRNFEFGGDGFGANGNLAFGRNGLIQADLSRVRLSPGDDFGLVVKAASGGYTVAVSGKSADARHVIRKMKTDYEGEAGGETAGDVSLTLKLDRLTGFNDETLTNVTAHYALAGGAVRAADFSGVTGSGQAVVSQLLKDGRDTISITSGDAGAFARFLDLYGHMQGGLLNLKLSAMDAQSWSGSVDVRSFRVMNEQRLQSIVTTPSGQDGRSLNSALKRDIDVSSAGFQRAFARVVVRNGVLAVENGILRGDQVGATFQGTVRDRRGNMDMTGTFMPAYGLNRLFAELPLIGAILGNGRDRGLIGITFKLSGTFTKPNLTVNPLSIIAPGVFRQIFEF